ncbi:MULTISPECIES: DUF397 domain-containing protein [unclassified Nocardiopsis]|uniref:DUF397 domain-containing protein n=1 Tax=unclassified Nocardiopsis TaxID=2649073 RepID=UPI00135C8977|nr:MULTISPECIES: DUF397 domain-containing protein [unclassified Nocardiopsis]
MTVLSFKKSSYSGTGEDCVEVAQFPARFRKSSYSGRGQNCIEVARLLTSSDNGAAIRDSKHPDAGHLPFPATEWSGFLRTALSQ